MPANDDSALGEIAGGLITSISQPTITVEFSEEIKRKLSEHDALQAKLDVARKALEYIFASGQPLLTSRAIRQAREALAQIGEE